MDRQPPPGGKPACTHPLTEADQVGGRARGGVLFGWGSAATFRRKNISSRHFCSHLAATDRADQRGPPERVFPSTCVAFRQRFNHFTTCPLLQNVLLRWRLSLRCHRERCGQDRIQRSTAKASHDEPFCTARAGYHHSLRCESPSVPFSLALPFSLAISFTPRSSSPAMNASTRLESSSPE